MQKTQITNNQNNKETKVLRINSIVDIPSSIETLFALEQYHLLAIGRSDNSIEIWNTLSWVQLIKIYGTKSNSIRKVFMIKKEQTKNVFDNLRVFSIGLNGYLIEWSLLTLQPKIFYQNPGGCLWDVDFRPESKMCLLGCDDGSVRAIRIKKKEFIMEKQFSKTDSKILSVKWSDNGNNFYTGLSNGHILKWDFKSGQVQLTLNIASNKIIKRQNKLGLDTNMIWTLNEINNKFLFSGDSNGTFRVWDCEFGVLIKEFKEHEADILTCCKNKKYNTIYFTGSDSLICAIQLINDEWILTSKFRGQSHDVNSVCLLNEENLLSGGMTTDVCIYKLQDSRFIEKYDRKVNTSIKRHISAFEQKVKIYLAQGEEDNLIILHRKLNKLNLWSVNENNLDKSLLLAEVNKKNDSNIISANISSNGKYFSYSDSENTVIFSYDYLNNEIKKIKTLKNLSSRFLFFSKDEKSLICLDNSNRRVHIYDINKETTDSINLSEMKQNEIILNTDYFENEKERYLAFSTLNKNLIFVNLKKSTVEYSLPYSLVYTTQIKFLNKDILLAVGEDNKFLLINVNEMKFTEWTNKNINKFPKNYLTWYNKIMGVASSIETINQKELPQKKTRSSKTNQNSTSQGEYSNAFLLYTDYNYIKIDIDKEIPDKSAIFRDKGDKIRNAEWSKKIKEYHKIIFNENYKGMKGTEVEFEIFNEISNEETKFNFENENFKITSRFSSILYMEYLKDKEEGKVLLVVENDWNKILKEFPETVAKFNYGY